MWQVQQVQVCSDKSTRFNKRSTTIVQCSHHTDGFGWSWQPTPYQKTVNAEIHRRLVSCRGSGLVRHHAAYEVQSSICTSPVAGDDMVVSISQHTHHNTVSGPVLSNRMLGHCLPRAGIQLAIRTSQHSRRESLADLRNGGTMI